VKCAPPSLTETIHEFVIFLVGTNPKPNNIFVFTPRNGTVMETDINRPDVALRGKAQGWMRKPEVRGQLTEVGGRKEQLSVMAQ
jgi:hypothetical protein